MAQNAYNLMFILLLATMQLPGQSSYFNSETCWGENPTYYTTSNLKVWEHMSTNSAITGEIPKGEAVKVTNSFFGDTGWWEVCYKGKKGWVKKAYLTFDEPAKTTDTYSSKSSTDNIASKYENYDVGFDPFIGTTISGVNFRTAPTTNSSIIKILSIGTQVYVYSDKTINSYYKAIDIMTSKIGWIHKDYVKWTEKATVNQSGAFQSTGYSDSYDSEVQIRNKSIYTITLELDGEVFQLTSNSTKTYYLKPGLRHYLATAPGVIPASGFQSFQSNNGYEWEFWVVTTGY